MKVITVFIEARLLLNTVHKMKTYYKILCYSNKNNFKYMFDSQHMTKFFWWKHFNVNF
jgi:hypothetical protein